MDAIVGKGIGSRADAMYWLWTFDSVREFLDKANQTADKQMSDYQGTRNGFYATESFAEAYQLGINGWAAVRPQVDGVVAPLRERIGKTLSEVQVPVFDVVGSRPDIDRYLDGELECMVEDIVEEMPTNGKVFTLVIDTTITDTAANTAEAVIERGAVIIALVESFAMLGYQLELWTERTITNAASRGSEFASFLVRVAAAGEPLDIDAVMFALGHPDWNRRIAFAVAEGFGPMRSKFSSKHGGNYGHGRQGAHHLDRVGASAVISLDGNKEMTADPEAWILGQLEMQGVWSRD